MDSQPNFEVICNVVSILPVEYDVVSEVEKSEDDFNLDDLEKYRFMCCYASNYGYDEKQKAILEKSNGSMKGHLKPLLIQVNVDVIEVNNMLVDGGVAVNLMSQSLLKKIGKFDTDL